MVIKNQFEKERQWCIVVYDDLSKNLGCKLEASDLNACVLKMVEMSKK